MIFVYNKHRQLYMLKRLISLKTKQNALNYGAATVLIAVSYTHLDVYKRQLLYMRLLKY